MIECDSELVLWFRLTRICGGHGSSIGTKMYLNEKDPYIFGSDSVQRTTVTAKTNN